MNFKEKKHCSRKFCTNYDYSLDERSFCRECTKELCCMKYMEDSIGRHSCNQLLPLIKREEGNYCIGHWKQLIKNCRHCSSIRVKIARDGWAYCQEHKPDDKTCLAFLMKELPIPSDVTNVIFKRSSQL